MDLSVVIVNWNTRELLRACLQSLEAERSASTQTMEVLVVDNASADGSTAMVRDEFPAVRLFANPENRNYAAASNQALREASGAAVLLLNPDTEVPPGTLEALLEDLRLHPDWGAVAPALVHPDGRVQESVRGFPTPRALLGEITGIARLAPTSAWGSYRPRGLPADRPSLVDQPMASAFLVRKTALDEVGLFDESFPLFFNDVDLCFRLKAVGRLIAYDPRVRVTHHGGAGTGQVRPEAIRKSHEGLERFYAKHYGHIPGPVYALMIMVIRLAGRWRAARAAGREGEVKLG